MSFILEFSLIIFIAFISFILLYLYEKLYSPYRRGGNKILDNLKEYDGERK
jgi:hypothetical protein